MSLRLPNALRFTHWMAESLDVLEKSPDAAPSDKRFTAWVRMQRIVEECGTAMALDDPSERDVSLAEERVQAVLRACERRLSDWRKSDIVDKEVMNRNDPVRQNEILTDMFKQHSSRSPTMPVTSIYMKSHFIPITMPRTFGHRSS